MVCELINVSSRSGVPESLQFTSILPRTLLVMMVPFLRGWMNSYGKGRGQPTHLFTTASSVSTISKYISLLL